MLLGKLLTELLEVEHVDVQVVDESVEKWKKIILNSLQLYHSLP